MKPIIFSLRYRFMIVIAIVSIIAVTIIGVLSNRIATIAFNRYRTPDTELSLDRFKPLLLKHYNTHNGWNDAQSILAQITDLTGQQLLLLDSNNKLIASAPINMQNATLQLLPGNKLNIQQHIISGDEAGVRHLDLVNPPKIDLQTSEGTKIGSLIEAPIPPLPATSANFMTAMNRMLLPATLISIVIALIAAVFLANKIVRPIDLLTHAVQKMGDGDLSSRVNITSKDEVGTLSMAFNAMADRIEKSEQLRRNLVNDIAHELRTPLTSIRCMLESLQDGISNPTPELINSIHEESMLLNQIIDDLQELALAEAGKLKLNLQSVSLSDSLNQAVTSLQQNANLNGVIIKLNVPKYLLDVYADPVRIGQVIRILLTNAITHTPRGGQVKISAQLKGQGIEIVVSDTGIGINPEHLPFIFERFYRADSSRNRATGGAGLGLAIAKQIVQMHGGSISAESVKGEGTTIRISI